ncbi:PepSY domain-containing protein [Spartinivicinus poritis]|uniref:PepSY domain-containing protein n=1 Tax=Spartinivicinus poritis TaxID=2994640 RepID=A0ABT5UBR0_9GAMM|nr:PepSY domain-containing protein [Spartinivicinus sp. A2-2]MDE1463620.1 PepSY domain-containing protein [Spartinivicinus sp. A2-2]
MKNANKLVPAALASVILAGSIVVAHAGDRHGRDGKNINMSDVNVTMEQAISTALQAVPGTVVEGELEAKRRNRGKKVWEIEVRDGNGKFHEIEVDAATGELISQELDD